MVKAKRERKEALPESKEQETFRDYLRRVMAEEGITDRQIEEATKNLTHKVSKSWVNLVLTQNGVKNAGIKTLASLAQAINRSREEVEAAFMEEPLGKSSQLIANIATAFEKLSDSDREHYARVLQDVVRSMRRAAK